MFSTKPPTGGFCGRLAGRGRRFFVALAGPPALRRPAGSDRPLPPRGGVHSSSSHGAEGAPGLSRQPWCLDMLEDLTELFGIRAARTPPKMQSNVSKIVEK